MDDVAAVVIQRTVWKKTMISVLSLAALTNAQTYAMHKIKTLSSLTSVSVTLRCLEILLEIQRSWLIDHKKLIYILNQSKPPDLRVGWLGKVIPFSRMP